MKNCCLCEEMKQLWKEQKLLTEFGKEFRYIHIQETKDTIPFMLITAKNFKPFTAIIDGNTTPYFRLEKIDEESCCVQLSLLQPVDLKGWQAFNAEDLYALKKTDKCIFIKLCCFCAINPLPIELVERPLPIIESKK